MSLLDLWLMELEGHKGSHSELDLSALQMWGPDNLPRNSLGQQQGGTETGTSLPQG